MCTLHIFFSKIARFSHTSTVTRLYSCAGRKTLTPRVHLVLYRNKYFLNIFKTKYTTKSTSVSYNFRLGAYPPPPPTLKQACSYNNITIYVHTKEEHFNMFKDRPSIFIVIVIPQMH